jgi:hypothetical protein
MGIIHRSSRTCCMRSMLLWHLQLHSLLMLHPACSPECLQYCCCPCTAHTCCLAVPPSMVSAVENLKGRHTALSRHCPGRSCMSGCTCCCSELLSPGSRTAVVHSWLHLTTEPRIEAATARAAEPCLYPGVQHPAAGCIIMSAGPLRSTPHDQQLYEL